MSLNLYAWTQSNFPDFYFEAYKKVQIFILLLSFSCVARFGALQGVVYVIKYHFQQVKFSGINTYYFVIGHADVN